MATVRSKFIVDVSAQGANAVKGEIDKLQRAAADSSDRQRSGLMGASKALDRMNQGASELLAKFSGIERSIRGMAAGLKAASDQAARLGAPGGAGGGGAGNDDGGVGAGATLPFPTRAGRGGGGAGDRAAAKASAAQAKAQAKADGAKAKADAKAMRDAAKSQKEADRATARQARETARTDARAARAKSKAEDLAEEKRKRDEEQKKIVSQAFGHGLVQGLMPGNLGFVQRGPGALRQGLGMMTGNIASSLMTMPFLGSSGLGGAAGALGSLISSPLNRFMGRADEASSFQRQQMGMMPLLGGQGAYNPNMGMSDEGLARSARAAAEADVAVKKMTPMRVPMGLAGYAAMTNEANYDPKIMRRNALASHTARLTEQREQDKYSAVSVLGAPGRNLMGVGLGQMQQFYSTVASAGGGTAAMAGQGFLTNAMAANTLLGTSPETAGALSLGARQNAVIGAGSGDASKLLLDLVNQTRSLGLQGSDQQQYLQTMADGIRQFQQSGMPLQKDSIYGITKAFTGLGGMTTMQAGQAAMGMTAKASSMYGSGPQTSLDLAILQAGGFKGGADSLLGTERKFATDSSSYAQSFAKVLPKVASSKSKEKRIAAIARAFSEQGISSDVRVATRAEEQMRANGGRLSPDMIAAIGSARDTKQDLTEEDLRSQASGRVSDYDRKRADMSNQGIVSGSNAASLSIELDAAANDTAVAVGKFSGLLLKMAQAAHLVTGAVVGDNSAASPNMYRPSKG